MKQKDMIKAEFVEVPQDDEGFLASELLNYGSLEKCVLKNIPLAIKNEEGGKMFVKVSDVTRAQIAKKIVKELLRSYTLKELDSVSVDEIILEPKTLPVDGEVVKVFNGSLKGVSAQYRATNQTFVLKNGVEIPALQVDSWRSMGAPVIHVKS